MSILEYTKEQLERAKEWKAIADKYNLSMLELHEIAIYCSHIKNVLNKPLKDRQVIKLFFNGNLGV